MLLQGVRGAARAGQIVHALTVRRAPLHDRDARSVSGVKDAMRVMHDIDVDVSCKLAMPAHCRGQRPTAPTPMHLKVTSLPPFARGCAARVILR